ncbi:MAG: sigma-54 dependent transcriptional regulator [Patescibacteria group bacterium]|jgi:DNA-binding NtrC family response regulator|nr:sigma-54 dependent transcriptional regulator [Patescibacteria group bacterium]
MDQNKSKILIIDDDLNLQKALFRLFRKHEVLQAYNCKDGFALLKENDFETILLDVVLPDGNGLNLLKKIQELDANIPVIVISGIYDPVIASESFKKGAYDFISKPLDAPRLRSLVNKAVEAAKMAHVINKNDLPASPENGFEKDIDFIVNSKNFKKVFAKLRNVAPMKTNLLLLGESGVGKSKMARLVHNMSQRRQENFVEVNLTTINENLMESHLFGHVKGSFTGAVKDNQGLFAKAHRGTIFLDEIGDIPKNIQVKLLQVIQDGIFYPVGSNQPVEVNVRLIAATVHDLRFMVKQGTFREDLYYRINVFPIVIPPLRQRKQSIPLLVKHFTAKICKREGIKTKIVTPQFIETIKNYDWPGNVRELENVVEYSVTVSRQKPKLEKQDIEGFFYKNYSQTENIDFNNKKQPVDFIIPKIDKNFNFDEFINDLSRKIITYSLAKENGNKTRTAKLLNISRRRLNLQIKRLDIKTTSSRGRPKKTKKTPDPG